MRRLAAFTVLTILTLSIAVSVNAWTVEDCEEVNYDHPDCDQYPTTTTYQTTTTTSEVTTTTLPECDEDQCPTTTTQPETTTTTPFEEQTTTTGAPCAEGLIHQPPLCVPPPDDIPTTLAPTETVPAPTTPEGEETLPFTGSSAGMLVLASLSLLVLGGAMVRKGGTE